MIIVGRFQDEAHRIDNGSIDVIVTSPPYKDEDGYSDALMRSFGHLCRDKLKNNGRVFFNFGQLKGAYSRPFGAACEVASAGGLQFEQTIIWVKSIAISGEQRGHYQPINSDFILNYCWEYIFVLSKGAPTTLNRLSIGVPFKDKSNLTRGDRGVNGDLHCAGDVWFIPYETTGASEKKKHAHEFPEELVRRCLLLHGGSVVLDPFAGSGTVGRVAKQLGKSYILIEKSVAIELR